MHRKPSFWIGLVACIVMAALQVLGRLEPDPFSRETWNWIGISWTTFCILVIVFYTVLRIRERFSTTAAVLVVVMVPALAVAVLAGAPYVMSSNLGRNGVPFGRTSDGQFRSMIDINGSALEFFVDLDSKYVLLSPSAAERIGIDPSTLTFNVPIVGPDGPQSAAATMLKSMAIRDTPITDVPALVSDHELETNVLGRDFFDRTSEWGIVDGFLVILP